MSLHRSLTASRLRPLRCPPSAILRTLPGPLSSGRRHFSIVDTAASAVIHTAEAFSAVHNLGIPWYVTIPLVAGAFNFTVRLPLQIYQNKIRTRRIKTQPLRVAWNGIASGDVPKPMLRIRWEQYYSQRRFHYVSAMHKRFGCRFRNIFASTIAGFAPILLVSWSMGLLCGLRTLAPETIARGKGELAALAESTATSLVDHSLEYGGMLWFTDLTVPGPIVGLPLILVSLTVLSSRMYHPKTLLPILQQDGSKLPRIERIGLAVQRVALIYPFLFLVWGMWLPNCIMYYFCSSSCFYLFNRSLLRQMEPKPKKKKEINYMYPPSILVDKDEGKR